MADFNLEHFKCPICMAKRKKKAQVMLCDDLLDKIKVSLREGVPLYSICKIFGVGLVWLLTFVDKEINLNGGVSLNNLKHDDFEFHIMDLDSYCRCEKDFEKIQLWIVVQSSTNIIIALHLSRNFFEASDCVLSKLPRELRYRKIFQERQANLIYKIFGNENPREEVIPPFCLQDYKKLYTTDDEDIDKPTPSDKVIFIEYEKVDFL